ncbi:MAG: DUF6115 domain-containing protein [Wujia sp.]
MSGTVIVLMIIGVVFIVVSFMLTEKMEEEKELETSMVQIPKELTQEQKEKVDKLLQSYMDEQVDGKLTDIETRLSEIVNQKTLALGDYAVTVNEEIDRNHKEVVFLYDMLSEKQKDIMTTANMVDDYKKEVETMVQHGTAQVVLNQEPVEEDVQHLQTEEEAMEEAIKEMEETPVSEDLEAELANVDNKDMILEMHNSGLSILEIAKHLGLGVGEVKLVVDLYQGEA